MRKSSCFDGEETEPETFVSHTSFLPCGMQGFEHIFWKMGKVAYFNSHQVPLFLHMLIPIPLSARRAV